MESGGEAAGAEGTTKAGDSTPPRPAGQEPTKGPRHSTLASLTSLYSRPLQSLSGLDTLLTCSNLFINPSNNVPQCILADGEPITESYEILDQSGAQILFGVALVKKCWGSVRLCPSSFEVRIKDSEGEALIQVKGSTRWFGRKPRATVKVGQEPYGSVEQDGDLCTPEYTVNDSKADGPLLKIRPNGPANCFHTGVPLDYTIFNGEFATIIGKVSTKLAKDLSTSSKIQGTAPHASKGLIIGAKFPPDLPLAQKILVLATLFLLRIS